MKKQSKRNAWWDLDLTESLLLLMALLWLGLGFWVFVLAYEPTPTTTFQTLSLPRFEISIAHLPDGSQVRILFDRTTRRDYLTTISARGGVSTVSLPYKND